MASRTGYRDKAREEAEVLDLVSDGEHGDREGRV
jgi:hypothetical protein